MLVKEYYSVQRSRNQGKWWVNLTPGIEVMSEKYAREYMESLHREHPSDWYRIVRHTEEAEAGYFGKETYDMKSQEEYKSRPNLVAKWELGPEYEFAYCSHCGHMEHAGWDTHSDAAEMIGTFHEEYKFCPNCGAKMEGKDNGNN